MQRSTDRFLTTHTGSLPRPDDLIRTMFAQGGRRAGRSRRRLSQRVARRRRRRSCASRPTAGVDVVNDGEMSKPSYATYIKDRLSGFGGDGQHVRLPGPRRVSRASPSACSATPGARGARRRRATRRSRVRDPAGGRRPTSRTCRPRWPTVDAQEAFLTAASPGVVSLFFRNEHYPSDEAYLYAIAEAMRDEYETIAERRASSLQIDCPDLGDGPPHPVRRPERSRELRKKAQLHVEALNHALREHSARAAAHAPVLGQLRGPAPLRRAARRHHRHRVPRRGPRAIAFEAANPRHAHEWKLFETVKLPEGKVLIPGVIESKSNFIEHPELIAQRIGRYANLVGRENVMAGSDCGYGTWVGQAAVDPDVVWAKMAAMAEGARIASREFWGEGS